MIKMKQKGSGIMIDVIRVMPIITLSAVVIGIFFMIKRSGKRKSKLDVIALPLIAVLISAASWLMNLGWYRVILLMLAISGFDIIIFFWSNVVAVPYIFDHRMFRIVNILYNITYIVFWVFFPDGIEGGTMYCFFGLVHNDLVSKIASVIAFLAAVINLLLFIWHTILVLILKLRKEKSEEILSHINLKQGELNNEQQ